MAKSNLPSGSDENEGLVTKSLPETPEEVEAFWNAERRNAAQPVPMPTVPSEPGDSADAEPPRTRPT